MVSQRMLLSFMQGPETTLTQFFVLLEVLEKGIHPEDLACRVIASIVGWPYLTLDNGETPLQ